MDKNTKSLEDLSIYELRDVARNVGVQSPYFFPFSINIYLLF